MDDEVMDMFVEDLFAPDIINEPVPEPEEDDKNKVVMIDDLEIVKVKE